MRILALDVSVSGCSVSFLDTETQYSCARTAETERGQAELLIPMVEQLVAESGKALSDINLIAVTRGPGSFTGVRIGLATARSLGLALNIPVVGFSTLDVMARSKDNLAANTLFLIDTKRDDYYGQIGEGAEPRIWSKEEVKNYAGPVIADMLPDVTVLASMAAEKGSKEKTFNPDTAPTPLYLRGAEVSQSKQAAPPVCFTDLE